MDQTLLIACQQCRRQYDVGGLHPGDTVRCRCSALLKVPEAGRRLEARIIHCASCGGKLREKAARCDYCGGDITKEDRHLGPACPICFSRLRAGARFCSTCGEEICPSRVKAIPAGAQCPRCRGGLVFRELDQVHYTECGGCGGMWLDCESFEAAVKKNDMKALSGLVHFGKEAAAKGGVGSTPGLEEVRYLPCPICRQLMHRKNFGKGSGVIIDWCKSHGFWFDTYELEKVIAFVQDGGLDKTREREIHEAREELKLLQAQRSRSGSETWRTTAHADVPDGWGGVFLRVMEWLVSR